MNTAQYARQIQHLMQLQKWPGAAGSDDEVWGARVVNSVAPDESAFQEFGFPCALIAAGAASRDPEHGEAQDLFRTEFRITLLQAHEGDLFGEGGLVTAALEGLADSDGRGIYEFESPLDLAIGTLNALEGAQIQAVGSGAVAAEWFGDVQVAAWRHSFEALIARQPHYAPPRRLRVTASGGGSISLAWGSAPTARYDFLRHRLVRKAGGTPPASETDGVAVFTGTGTSFTDSVVGENSYAVFAEYDPYTRDANGVAAPATPLRFSEAAERGVTATGTG